MRILSLLVLILASFSGFAQKTFTDERDGQEYRYTNLLGKKWMLDNLNYFTELSLDLSEEERAKYDIPPSRWYHQLEIDTVCPKGWRLPTAEELIDYMTMITEEKNGRLKIHAGKEQISIWKIPKDLDLYSDKSPLGLVGIGIFEGESFFSAPVSADFWIQDMPLKSEAANPKYGVRVSHENRAHIHFF